jgi:hypothetical protein
VTPPSYPAVLSMLGARAIGAGSGLMQTCTVDRDEVDRLRKRFMKLDKVRRSGRGTYCLIEPVTD